MPSLCRACKAAQHVQRPLRVAAWQRSRGNGGKSLPMASRISVYDATVSLSRLTTVLTTPSLKPTLNLPSWFPPAAAKDKDQVARCPDAGSRAHAAGDAAAWARGQPGRGNRKCSACPAEGLRFIRFGARQVLGKLVSHPRQSFSAAKAGRAPSLCHTKCRACRTAQERSDIVGKAES